MALWSDLENINEFYSSMPNPHQIEALRRLIVARGPIVRLVAFDGNEQVPDDYEDDSTLILDRPAEEEADEDTFAEETERLPFDDEDFDDAA